MPNMNEIDIILTSIEKAFEVKGMPFSKEERKQWIVLIFDALGLDKSYLNDDEDNQQEP